VDCHSLEISSFRTWTVSHNILNTCKLAYNILYFRPSEITIGFEQGTYTVQEDLQPTVEVCAEILQGSIDRSTAATFTFGVQNGLAGAAKDLQTSAIDSTIVFVPF